MTKCTPSQNTPREFDAEKYYPPYSLQIFPGWGVERFAIPIEFAPSIPYKGVEDLRFAPGWSDPASEEYWSYAFLWYLEGKPEIDPQTTEKNLAAYYNGLVGRNIVNQKIPEEELVPVTVNITRTSVDEGDLQTYSGSIGMLDYMARKPITLNCIVHVKSCADENNTFVFYEISPRPFTGSVWKDLQKLGATLECR
jgi:hypothetical protein